MKETTAKLKYLRIAPRKVRLLADLIRGKSLEDAKAQLRFSGKKSSLPLAKLLDSAIANTKNNPELKKGEKLYIKKITVDEGPSYKRMMPRAQGRAVVIRKKTSHILISLGTK